MKLQAKVTETISGSESRDGQQRVKLKVEGADSMYRALIVANDDGLQLDDEVVLLVMTKQQASDLFDVLDGVEGERGLLPAPLSLRDQLRPDPLPPWEQPIDGKRLCCGHSDAVFNGRCTNTHMGQSDNMDVIVCGCRCITAEAGAHA